MAAKYFSGNLDAGSPWTLLGHWCSGEGAEQEGGEGGLPHLVLLPVKVPHKVGDCPQPAFNIYRPPALSCPAKVQIILMFT